MENRYGDEYNGSYIPRGPPSYSESNPPHVNGSYAGSIPRGPPSYAGSVPRPFSNPEKEFDDNRRIPVSPSQYNFIPPHYGYTVPHHNMVDPSYYADSNWQSTQNSYHNYPIYPYAVYPNPAFQAVRKPTYWVSMCVICAASIPKHFPSKCPTEMENFNSTWPSICYKCKPFIPLHDHEVCPNATALTSSAKNVDNYLQPNLPNQVAFKMKKTNRPSTYNKKSFKTASDGSVEGTTFLPEKTKKTFFQKTQSQGRSPLPPLASFLQPQDSEGMNHESRAEQRSSAVPNNPGSNKRESGHRPASSEYNGDFTLPDTAKRNSTYTTKLNFDDLEEKEEKRKHRRPCTGDVRSARKCTLKFSHASSRTILELTSQRHIKSDDNDPETEEQAVAWNDLSLIAPQECPDTAAGVEDKENSQPTSQTPQTVPNPAKVTDTSLTMIMDSDSEVDLYSSNDEEDVLISFSSKLKIKDVLVDVKTCLVPKIDSPESLSKKVRSCIAPIDEIPNDRNVRLNISDSLAMKRKRAQRKGLKKGCSHKICCDTEKIFKISSSVTDSLQLPQG